MVVPTTPVADPTGEETTETMDAVTQLAGWINQHYRYKEQLTHLKVQKLFFYCYGALLACDLEHELGPALTFEPWEHGPVNRELYKLFRGYGGGAITDFPSPGKYSRRAEECLEDALTVYGAMSAWSLRQQTHLEQPWREAYERKEQTIAHQKLKAFFKEKFANGSVAAPEYLFGLSNFKIDGIPVQSYPSLGSIARAVERVHSGVK